MGKMKHFVSEIFTEPETWGLRGDPFMWEYLKNHYTDIEVPYSIEKLRSDIFLIFQKFTGKPLERGEHYFVSEFPQIMEECQSDSWMVPFGLMRQFRCF